MNAAIACSNAMVTARCRALSGLIDGAWDGSGLTVTTNGGRWISGGAAGNAYTDSAATLTAAGGDCAATDLDSRLKPTLGRRSASPPTTPRWGR